MDEERRGGDAADEAAPTVGLPRIHLDEHRLVDLRRDVRDVEPRANARQGGRHDGRDAHVDLAALDALFASRAEQDDVVVGSRHPQ